MSVIGASVLVLVGALRLEDVDTTRKIQPEPTRESVLPDTGYYLDSTGTVQPLPTPKETAVEPPAPPQNALSGRKAVSPEKGYYVDIAGNLELFFDGSRNFWGTMKCSNGGIMEI
jgi:hypothetical protein